MEFETSHTEIDHVLEILPVPETSSPVLQPDVSCTIREIPFTLIAASPFPLADIVNRFAHELHHMDAVHR